MTVCPSRGLSHVQADNACALFLSMNYFVLKFAISGKVCISSSWPSTTVPLGRFGSITQHRFNLMLRGLVFGQYIYSKSFYIGRGNICFIKVLL